MGKLFPTYEVGSLPKLSAKVKAFASALLSDHDLAEIRKYGSQTGIDVRPALDILNRQQQENRRLTTEEKGAIVDLNALLNLKLQENAGLDYVYDGEARRAEMYRHVARKIDGFEDLPEMIRSRGPDSWRPSICVGAPKLKGSKSIIEEFLFVKMHAAQTIKVPLDDPYMIANMTLNKYFKEKYFKEKGSLEFPDDPRKSRHEAKRELTLALAKEVIRPQVEALSLKGAAWIQLDIPSATLDIEHIPIMVEGINAVVSGIDNIKFSLHLCYPRRKSLTQKSGYGLLFPALLELEPKIDHLSLELANGNQYDDDLAVFKQYQSARNFEIGLGVVDITLEKQQQGILETPKDVKERIVRAANVLGAENIFVAPDCGLRQLTLERALKIYDVVAQGAELARKG